MLEELDIRNLGPIREATIAPAAGMTAITSTSTQKGCLTYSAIVSAMDCVLSGNIFVSRTASIHIRLKPPIHTKSAARICNTFGGCSDNTFLKSAFRYHK